MTTAYTGKVLVVDLTLAKVKEEQLKEELYRDFIGGVGLGVRLLYERQPGKVDPLGEENILGFMPGLLGGTAVPGSSRLTVVSKSPLTGGWGDASVGGYIAPEIKQAGYDGILVQGISPRPVYLLLYQGKAELRDAFHLWGRDTIETQEILRKEIGDRRLRVICIGPAGEAQSLISAIMSEGREGRAAARSGLGAVMGSKRLKAIAVRGQNVIPVADSAQVSKLRRQFVNGVKETETLFIKALKTGGTAGYTHPFVTAGATPFKNWSLIGAETMPAYEPFDDRINKYVVRRSACAGCPIGCSATLKSEEIGGEYDRPEYETVAAFGPMCLNNDVATVINANDICNHYGIDTISTGNVIAFAMECYERGIITKQDTDGIELTWGNGQAIVAMVEMVAKREGFGAILADGVKRAAERIGRGAEEWAIHVGGQELGYHDPRQIPSRGTAYICDPTPGRHTTFLVARLLEAGPLPGPYPEFWKPRVEYRDYGHKSVIYNRCATYEQVLASAGMCKFLIFQPGLRLIEFISAVTGWDFSLAETQVTGERIQTMRQLFNIREGIDPRHFRLPQRVSQPATMGPYKDAPLDFDLLRRQYYEAMGWDVDTGYPKKAKLDELGLKEFAGDIPR